MSILTHKCPHCLTEHIALQVMAVSRIKSHRGSVYLKCPKCGMPSCATVKSRAELGSSFLTSIMKAESDLLEAGLIIEEFWPEPPQPLIPDLLPPDVSRIYLQAERNFPIEGNEEAAGTMYRKALDIALKKIDPALLGMLGSRIKKLAAAGKLTANIAEWSDHIRDFGNDAAHEGEPIPRDELTELRSFSEMVLRYLFTLPNMVRKRRGERLDWETETVAEDTPAT